MTKLNDPADKTLDAQADGQFQTVDRRAGYGDKDETLARLIRWCKEGKQLAHSEMLALGKYIAGLEADAARLEWLANTLPMCDGLEIGYVDATPRVVIYMMDDTPSRVVRTSEEGPTLRAAIDAARHPTTEETT